MRAKDVLRVTHETDRPLPQSASAARGGDARITIYPIPSLFIFL